MLNRWIGIAAGFFMLLANAAILYRDVLPDWLAGDPPPNEARLLQPGERHAVQVGIYDAAGRALGTSWTVSNRVGEAGIIGVKTTTLLESICLPGGITTPRVRIETIDCHHWPFTERPAEVRRAVEDWVAQPAAGS